MLESGDVFRLLFQNPATDQFRLCSLILGEQYGNQIGLIDNISWRCIQCVTDELRCVVKLFPLEGNQPGQMPGFGIRWVFLKDLQVRGRGSVRVTGNMALVPISEPALNACGRHGSSLKQPGGNSCRYRTARLIRAPSWRTPPVHIDEPDPQVGPFFVFTGKHPARVFPMIGALLASF